MTITTMKADQLVNLARLSLTGKEADVRLYLAKMVRKARKDDPELAKKIEELLKSEPTRSNGIMRRAPVGQSDVSLPQNSETPTLIKSFDGVSADKPLLVAGLEKQLAQVIAERAISEKLAAKGLKPTSSMIFDGLPGVGKTMTAHWLSIQLGLPFYVLDLTSVMSSLLGKTGSNLRAVIEFAKSTPCVLLLDEVDAIAKKRSDEADVGELKRLVTVMLQELENWPAEGMLIAATNHPELVDPAIWRRFDMEITFPHPDEKQLQEAVALFLGDDSAYFEKWLPLLVDSLKGNSYSNIKRSVHKLRRMKLVDPSGFEGQIVDHLIPGIEKKERSERIELAVKLVSEFSFPKQRAARITGVSRDTIRKRI